MPELDITDAKSLLQANATILAGALIFLTLLHETFDPLVTWSFLGGIYSLIVSIAMCLATTWKGTDQRISLIERIRRGTCILGLFLLFLAMTLFLI
ncbi:MAG: hypothetical protein K5798_01810 [Nitrosopumilus sp.]|uniref:hypothetical protein n=1 Tax=Nitrosopumilus sp. TaxID=2024843 RepID=UPI00242E285D|nr:hypothetical protein [Nitrosopumilus sp.]MCV0365987.1 hypothetical protein [Nitrosopumilus sp.]